MDSRRMEAISGVMVASTIGLARAIQISALKMDQRLMMTTTTAA
jgi:hypothetical protein